MSKGLFITGTGTDVGKTYISGLIVKKLRMAGYRAGYYKAAVSGNERDKRGELIPGDPRFVKTISGISQAESTMCPYIYETACSPHLAARLEGKTIKKNVILKGFQTVSASYDYITMEGSGGILCPLSHGQETLWLWELIKELQIPCLMVADAGLGTINQIGLTAFFMKEKEIPLKGIILNHYHPGNLIEEDNLHMCEELTGVKVIACVRDGAEELESDAQTLAAMYEEGAAK